MSVQRKPWHSLERSDVLPTTSIGDRIPMPSFQALINRKMPREGIFREMKLRRNYEKPPEKRAREKAEVVRRTRKLLRKRMEREGY